MTRPSSRVLLGRSFLKRYLVTYNGPEGLFHYYDPISTSLGYVEDLDG
jgi:hypothetical protein